MLRRTERKRGVAGERAIRRVITELGKRFDPVLEVVIHEEIGPIKFGALIGPAPHVKSFDAVAVRRDTRAVTGIKNLTVLAGAIGATCVTKWKNFELAVAIGEDSVISGVVGPRQFTGVN